MITTKFDPASLELSEELSVDDLKKPGVLVVSACGVSKGRTTGDHRLCRLEGCGGRQFKVKWSKGRPTWICSKALVYFKRLVKLQE